MRFSVVIRAKGSDVETAKKNPRQYWHACDIANVVMGELPGVEVDFRPLHPHTERTFSADVIIEITATQNRMEGSGELARTAERLATAIHDSWEGRRDPLPQIEVRYQTVPPPSRLQLTADGKVRYVDLDD
ncbi:MAG TPA: hypothetical protein VLF67_02415 [Candidatus Saccharimonas sp.]|nr:hypothetical protein [Candidatus Saccharimonas sp.]